MKQGEQSRLSEALPLAEPWLDRPRLRRLCLDLRGAQEPLTKIWGAQMVSFAIEKREPAFDPQPFVFMVIGRENLARSRAEGSPEIVTVKLSFQSQNDVPTLPEL